MCGTEGSAFLPLLVVCSAIGGGSGDSMIHLTSTLEVVRGWQGCRRRRRDSFAVCECEPWGGISFIAFISLPWPSALVSVLHQYYLIIKFWPKLKICCIVTTVPCLEAHGIIMGHV